MVSYRSVKGQDVPGAEPNQPIYAIDMDPPNGRLRYFTGKQLSAGN